jgi:hypothetical protein
MTSTESVHRSSGHGAPGASLYMSEAGVIPVRIQTYPKRRPSSRPKQSSGPSDQDPCYRDFFRSGDVPLTRSA